MVPFTKKVFYMESSCNIVFGSLMVLAPRLLMEPMIPPEDHTTINDNSIEFFRWAGTFIVCFSGVLFLRGLYSGDLLVEKLIQESHLLGDVLYVGSVALWVHRTGYYLPGNVFNVVYGLFLFIVRVVRVLELRKDVQETAGQHKIK